MEAIGEIERQEEVEDQLPTIQEENGNDLGTVIAEKRTMAGSEFKPDTTGNK